MPGNSPATSPGMASSLQDARFRMDERRNRELEKKLEESKARVVELMATICSLEIDNEERSNQTRLREDELRRLHVEALQLKLQSDCEMTRAEEYHSVELAFAQEKIQLLNTLLNDAILREKDEKCKADRLRAELDTAHQNNVSLKHDLTQAVHRLRQATIDKEQAQHNARHPMSKDADSLQREKDALHFMYQKECGVRHGLEMDQCREDALLRVMEAEHRAKRKLLEFQTELLDFQTAATKATHDRDQHVSNLDGQYRSVVNQREKERYLYEECGARHGLEIDQCREDALLRVMEAEHRTKRMNRVAIDTDSIQPKLTALEQMAMDYKERCSRAETMVTQSHEQREELSRAHRAELLEFQTAATNATHDRDQRAANLKEMEDLHQKLEDDLRRSRMEVMESRKQMQAIAAENRTLQSALCVEREGKFKELSSMRKKLEDLVAAQAEREQDIAWRKDEEVREIQRSLEAESQRRLETSTSKHQKRENDLRNELCSSQAAAQKLGKELEERDATITQLQQRMGKLHGLCDDLQVREHHILQDRDIRERYMAAEFSMQRTSLEQRLEELEGDRITLCAQVEELSERLKMSNQVVSKMETDSRVARLELRNASDIINSLETTLTRERAVKVAGEGSVAAVESEAARLRILLAAVMGELEGLRGRKPVTEEIVLLSPKRSGRESGYSDVEPELQRHLELQRLVGAARASGKTPGVISVGSHLSSHPPSLTDDTLHEARRRLVDARSALKSILEDENNLNF